MTGKAVKIARGAYDALPKAKQMAVEKAKREGNKVTKKLKSGRWVCRGCLPGLFERYARGRAPKNVKTRRRVEK
ncbi:hypothetical protein ES706_03739 [subsurface metagenome]